VENETQLTLLRALGCNEAPGFFIASPQGAEQLQHHWR
jgi:EAL domain-containing protein (putative c-di-GMP-specific phosphodiesterase class I)